MIDAIEKGLLGRVALSFDIAGRRGLWTPEPEGAACWRCAGAVGPHEADGDGCAACRLDRLPWERALRLASYDDERVRGAILDLKYRAWRRTGDALGRALGQRIASALESTGIKGRDAVIVPVPMPWRRRVLRGVDHTLVLARGAGATSGCRVMRVLRARHHPRQVGLSATARRRNISRVFRVRRGFSGRLGAGGPVRVLIVLDDVCTTRSTLVTASRALRRVPGVGGEGARVWVACVAVSPDRARRVVLCPQNAQEVDAACLTPRG